MMLDLLSRSCPSRLQVYAALIFIAASLSSHMARAEPARYTLDPDHTVIGFLVDHVGFAKVLGMFRKSSGSFDFDDETGELSNLRVVIETESVFTNNRRRDQHLRGSDFLNVGEYPEMVFEAKTTKRAGDRGYEMTGTLTLLGVSRPVTLEATWNKSAESPFGKPFVTGVSARGSIKRSEFGMTYAVENGWVGDEIELIVEFEAKRQ